jgi:hypothetical protein
MTKQLRMEGEITNIIQGDAFKSLARLDEFPLAA